MNSDLRSLPAAALVPIPDPADAADDGAVLFSRFPLARFDTAPPIDPVAAGAEAAAARSAEYADPALATIAPFIDRAYYLACYPDIARYGGDPVTHYSDAGWREGRRPNTWFDPAYYLRANPDIAEAGIEPLLHYLRHGRGEGRLPDRPAAERRAVLDRATPPASRPPGYDAPDWAKPISGEALAAALARACFGARGLVLSVSHDRYIDIIGGVQVFIADEQSLFNGDRCAYLHISPVIARATLATEAPAGKTPAGKTPAAETPTTANPGAAITTSATMQIVLNGRLIGLADTDTIVAALAALPPDAPRLRLLVVHALFGHRVSALLALDAALRPRRRLFWLHDYGTVCEGYNLMRDDVEFCHAPPPESMSCRICVYGENRLAYRAAIHALFTGIAFDVVAPSAAALELWLAKADLPHRSARIHANATLQEAPALPGPPPGRRVRVAFIGYTLAHKGWPVFLTLVEQLRGLQTYRFYHFADARSLRPMDGLVSVPLRVDAFNRFAAVAALAAHEIDLVLMLSPWPETFSYVTHEALAAGADVITIAGSGNVADVVRARQRGVVLRDEAALLHFFRDLHALHYADARTQAGIRPGVLQPTGTLATLPLDGPAGPHAQLLTDDPDLRVIAGTTIIAPQRADRSWRFILPEGLETVRLVSRWRVPAARRMGATDQRQLGVAVERLELDGEDVPIGDQRCDTGWHFPRDLPLEWTGGDALLRVDGARLLEVILAPEQADLPRYTRIAAALEA